MLLADNQQDISFEEWTIYFLDVFRKWVKQIHKPCCILIRLVDDMFFIFLIRWISKDYVLSSLSKCFLSCDINTIGSASLKPGSGCAVGRVAEVIVSPTLVSDTFLMLAQR